MELLALVSFFCAVKHMCPTPHQCSTNLLQPLTDDYSINGDSCEGRNFFMTLLLDRVMDPCCTFVTNVQM